MTSTVNIMMTSMNEDDFNSEYKKSKNFLFKYMLLRCSAVWCKLWVQFCGAARAGEPLQKSTSSGSSSGAIKYSFTSSGSSSGAIKHLSTSSGSPATAAALQLFNKQVVYHLVFKSFLR